MKIPVIRGNKDKLKDLKVLYHLLAGLLIEYYAN